ncbi:Aste57867_23212 [Aphanomyces stellatus]|uniref:Aste57867_23212 protein n=1 Tax=Aphanomyces stellatus TaxID=120398 RepID=A0A485LMC0_9STRA|nr:hypothetical protein As57867_023141 [Aphanomyces stellatus]VFT99859.1 Aste57867_23212 [Aphanomyces stellatus]
MDTASFDTTVAMLEDMFPNIPLSKVRMTLAGVQGNLDAAVEALLDPSAAKKRKLRPDIRSYFQSSASGATPPKKIHIDTSLPPEFLHPDKRVQMATFEAWDPSKESQRPMLLTPETLSHHLPCLSLQLDFLPKEQANEVLVNMLESAHEWITTKWVIFEREVESPHLTQLYGLGDAQLRQKDALYTNTGTAGTKMKPFPPLLHAIKGRIDAAVNASLATRERHALEAKEPWAANIALANLYRTASESVGSHSDTMTELGPRPTIASYTLGAERVFRIRRLATDSVPAQTFNVKLPHNSLLLMFPPFQEFYRHEVPAQPPSQIKGHGIAHDTRVNLTFRMMRDNYVEHMPRCLCQKPAVLRTANRHTKKNVGEYFYVCAGSVPASCSYFCWLKDRMHLLEPSMAKPPTDGVGVALEPSRDM